MEFYEFFNIGSDRYVITIEGKIFKQLSIRQYGTDNVIVGCFWDACSELFQELRKTSICNPEDLIYFEELFQEDFKELIETENSFTNVFTKFILKHFNKQDNYKPLSAEYFIGHYLTNKEDDDLFDVDLAKLLTKKVGA